MFFPSLVQAAAETDMAAFCLLLYILLMSAFLPTVLTKLHQLTASAQYKSGFRFWAVNEEDFILDC